MTTIGDYDFLVIALFNATLKRVVNTTEKILQESSIEFNNEKRQLELAWVYRKSPPAGGAHATRSLFYEPETVTGTTAIIANLEDGWMTMCNLLAKQIPGQHLLARTAIDTEYPVTDFEIWKNGESARYVQALREEPNWVFFERGEVQAFEEPSNYKKRLIKNRLNRDILISYIAKLGWDLTNPVFWCSKAGAFHLELVLE